MPMFDGGGGAMARFQDPEFMQRLMQALAQARQQGGGGTAGLRDALGALQQQPGATEPAEQPQQGPPKISGQDSAAYDAWKQMPGSGVRFFRNRHGDSFDSYQKWLQRRDARSGGGNAQPAGRGGGGNLRQATRVDDYSGAAAAREGAAAKATSNDYQGIGRHMGGDYGDPSTGRSGMKPASVADWYSPPQQGQHADPSGPGFAGNGGWSQVSGPDEDGNRLATGPSLARPGGGGMPGYPGGGKLDNLMRIIGKVPPPVVSDSGPPFMALPWQQEPRQSDVPRQAPPGKPKPPKGSGDLKNVSAPKKGKPRKKDDIR